MNGLKLRLSIQMRSALIFLLAVWSAACGPRLNLPPRPAQPEALPGALAADDARAILARSLAPVLFLQPNEAYPLDRVVAVVHPTQPIIAYHLLWRDDVHGSWIPFTIPTDQEVVWVGYDSTGAPTDLWTYWHGAILHTDWRNRGTAAVDVQWGKHGSLPRGVVQSDLPWRGKLPSFYLFSWIGLPDIWLGRLSRPGPWCFCRGYGRYRQFNSPMLLGDRIDVVAQLDDPGPVLAAIFGRYAKKTAWPPEGP